MIPGSRGSGRGWVAWVAALLTIALCTPGVARGGQPTEQIRGAIERGLAITQRPDHRPRMVHTVAPALD